MIPKKLYTIGWVLIAILVVFFAYRLFFGSSTIPAGVTALGPDGQAVTDPNANVDADAQRFLALLESVKDIDKTINDQFIHDRFYTSLRDYTVPVPARPVSRANPFLTIGLGGAYATGGVGTGAININLGATVGTSTASTSPKKMAPAKTSSPSAQTDLLKQLQQQ